MGCGVCSRLERQTNLTPPYCCKKSKRRLVSSNLQMSVSEICCKKFFVFKSRLRRKRLKKNAFKYRYNSALIRFLIFPPVGQIFPPVGKKLLVVGKLFLEKFIFPNKLGKNYFFCLNMYHFLGKLEIVFKFVRIDIEEIA